MTGLADSRPLQILAVYGTRPEAIKMAPVISALRRRPDRFTVTVVTTGGLATLFDKHTNVFDAIEPDLTIQGLSLLYGMATSTSK